jgi:two-component system, cell cycle response regulator
LMKPKELPDLIAKNPRVPTLSPVAARVLALAANERTSARQLADIITADMGLSSKILGLANSSYYGGAAQTTKISDAVRVLGMRAVRNAVLGISVFDLIGKKGNGPSIALAMWERSLNVAALTRMLAQKAGLDAEEGFILGLLSDVGILAVVNLFPAEYVRCAPKQGMFIEEVLERERSVFGIDHQAAGRIMAERWNLPRSFSNAIAVHHSPLKEHTSEELELSTVLNVSASIVHSLYDGKKAEAFNHARASLCSVLGISRKEIDEILAILPERVTETISQFDLSIEAPISYVEALLKANEELAETNTRYEHLNRELEDANRKLKKMALVDGLTGLANRRSFDEALARECDRLKRYGGSLTLALADVDHFQTCNDTYGHLMGDDLLRDVGAIVAGSIRSSDLASRYGGDEFAVILPETDISAARLVLERLRAEIEKRVFQTEKGPVRVTTSFGLAALNRDSDTHSPSLLLKQAASMLYLAKQQGRNRVVSEDGADPELVTDAA